jgi:chaperonin GroEL
MSKPVKALLFNTEARNKLLVGLNKVADAVGSTLGPKGRNVAIWEPYGAPLVTHDGVSVAGSIDLDDKFEDAGAQLIKEAAQKTSNKAGDGTTVTTVLTQAIVNEALQNIQAGANPMTLKEGIEDSLKIALKELEKLTKKIETDEEIEQIATISAADPEKGKIVAEAFKKVGAEGIITVEEGKAMETTIDFKQGMEIDRGYLSPYFVTNQETVEAVIDDPYILLTDKKINYAKDLVPFIERLLPVTKNLVVFCGECVEEGMAFLVVNKLRGNINVVAVQAPAYGDRRADELQDIALLTGGAAILEDSGRTLDSVQVEELGRAEKVIVDRDKTVIINGMGDATGRIAELREQLKIANTEFDKQIKGQRLAKLAGSVAVINVGAASDVEMKEKKKRFINAVNATKAAVSDGVVAGGEITLLKLSEIKELNPIFSRALRTPFDKLLNNAGYRSNDTEFVLMMSVKDGYPYGVDVMDGQVKDLLKAGIIDPVKVTRSALENAVSVAGMIMSTDSIIAPIEKEEK